MRQNRLNDRFTEQRIYKSVVEKEHDKRRAGHLNTLLVDRWSDSKFSGKNYTINSNITTKIKQRLNMMGAEDRGLSRYFNT